MPRELKQDTLADICQKIRDAGIPDLADHIEAAWKRQMSQSWHHLEIEELIARHEKEVAELKNQTGNAAELRAAFGEIIEKIDAWRTDGTMEHWQYSQLFDIADAALAIPLRQCDGGMSFAEAIEHFKKGRLIRRAGDRVWCWLGKSGRSYYGLKRDYPLHFKDSWLTREILSDDWEVQEEGEGDGV